MNSVCVFCGSSTGWNAAYSKAAEALGAELARRRLRLIYGGGNIGLMGRLADAVLAAGGAAIGVIPQALLDKELAHQELTELLVVDSMHTRKAKMAELADAFIALPGGFGTFEEFCEVITWSQLGIHAKPCGILDVAGYYDPLLALFDRGVTDGFIRQQHRDLVLVDASPADLLDKLATYRPPELEKWIDADET